MRGAKRAATVAATAILSTPRSSSSVPQGVTAAAAFLSSSYPTAGSKSRRSFATASANGQRRGVSSIPVGGEGGGGEAVDGVTAPLRSSMAVHHLPSVGSTQDEAKRLLKKTAVDCAKPQNCFAVSASEQVNGRGTSGREWIGRRGNCFVTVCVPMDLIPVPITLLPLKVGSIVAAETHKLLRSHGSEYAKVSVKWPNDVLVDGGKIAGVLIETDCDASNRNYWFVIGIGVNVAHAPPVATSGPNRGRRSTCLAEFCSGMLRGDKGVEESKELAQRIAANVLDWLVTCQSMDKEVASKHLVSEWRNWAEWGKELTLRDVPGNEPVVPVDIEPDGQLRVRGPDGRERLLCAEYLL